VCDEALQHTHSHKKAMCDEVMPPFPISQEGALRSNATAGCMVGVASAHLGTREQVTTSFADQRFGRKNNVLTTGYIRDGKHLDWGVILWNGDKSNALQPAQKIHSAVLFVCCHVENTICARTDFECTPVLCTLLSYVCPSSHDHLTATYHCLRTHPWHHPHAFRKTLPYP
jgi:hypothetical protein